MPWKETCVLDQRMSFIVACQSGEESVSSLCRHYGISRRTGHKWLSRYREEGVSGLEDRSRAPHEHGRAMDPDVRDRLLSVRRKHTNWGPRKVKAYLEHEEGNRSWPAASTIGDLFDREGLTRPRKRRRRMAPQGDGMIMCRGSNDVWCADFKGWFRTSDGARIEPFTLSDAHSRYLLRCEAVACTGMEHVWPILDGAFREYGLPRALRTDNGSPFASLAVAGLSRLAVRLIKAGVSPNRIEPGKPQQNGRHERLHLTLKQDAASPPAATRAEQLVRLEHFRQVYNHERPHEALGQVPPARVYEPSPRRFDGVLRSPDYPGEALVRRVRRCGAIRWHGLEVFVSQALSGEPVGLYEIGNDAWLMKYGPVVLGVLKGREGFVRVGGKRASPARPRENKRGNL